MVIDRTKILETLNNVQEIYCYGMIRRDSGLEKMRKRFRIHELGRLFFLKSPSYCSLMHVYVKIIRYPRTSSIKKVVK